MSTVLVMVVVQMAKKSIVLAIGVPAARNPNASPVSVSLYLPMCCKVFWKILFGTDGP